MPKETNNPRPRRFLPVLRGCAFILAGLVVIGLLIWGASAAIDAVTPHIYRLSLLAPGQTEITISGRNFGASSGTLLLRTEAGSNPPRALPVKSWSDGQITASLPGGTPEGSLEVQRQVIVAQLSSGPHAFTTLRPNSSPASKTLYPTQPGALWPTFRRDAQNSGFSPIVGQYAQGQPWTFKTAKGIFSTPVIDAAGNIYFGSADHFFYALAPDGQLKWKYETGEIIDSAGALFDNTNPKEAGLVFISGDGNMYGFNLKDGIPNPSDRLLWKYTAELRPEVSFNRWFEGNVAVGPDGTLYAGNTNFNYYAINPSGSLKWKYPTDSNNWSQAAFGPDGTIYWGSLDTFIRAVGANGGELWRVRTLGFVAASAAVGSDGTVYIGSFDSNLYAINPDNGAVRWKFATQDHIYSSAALSRDARGNTNPIFFGSADGSLYALRPDGSLLWRYDTGDPIRSSPVIGLVPGASGAAPAEVVYFGAGNGKLYALNAADGSLRWAYDSTPDDPELRDRNDLNGSPALGASGIYIGGEHGSLVYVPYDYCLHASDGRCSTTNSDLPGRLGGFAGAKSQAGLFYVTPGGSTLPEFPASLPAASTITLRLVVVKDGQTQNAYVCNSPLGCPADDLQIQFNPALPFQADHSADGRYVYIRPQGFLAPNTQYQLTVKGRYYSGGWRLGNLTLLGTPQDSFEQSFSFRTAAAQADRPPLQVDSRQTTALEWSRLAAPLPPMLPSLNQIGFDYMDWLIGTIKITPPDSQHQGKVVLWAIGAKRGPDGALVVDPQSDFTLPLTGAYQDDSLILSNQSFKMAITGIQIPFNRFELRGQLTPGGSMQPGAAVFADTDALSIPKFGPYLVIAGLANNIYQKMLVEGTYLTRAYPSGGTANQAPAGVTVDQISALRPEASKDGFVTATFKLDPGASYALKEHRPGILLLDEDQGQVVFMDYHALLSAQGDPAGNLASVTLRLPASSSLPPHVQATIILDVFPLEGKTVVFP